MLALRLARRLTARRLHAFAVSGSTPPQQIASLLDEHGVVVIDDFLTTELDRVAGIRRRDGVVRAREWDVRAIGVERSTGRVRAMRRGVGDVGAGGDDDG